MSGVAKNEFQNTVSEYREMHSASTSTAQRNTQYEKLVNAYYDLATDFYEFGWGKSFHFAPRKQGESLDHAIARHEHFIADALKLNSSMKALDVGCGVGGPMREISRVSGAEIVGVNNNAYQVERGWKHTRKADMTDRCSFVRADFMQLPMKNETFDAVYTIEASCHAPDRVALFSELSRVMKPGAVFAGYEWCLTEAYKSESPRHQKIKRDIEEGNGLPDIAFTWEIDAWLKEAGFELIESFDVAPTSDVPWYSALTGQDKTLKSFPRTPAGRVVTNYATRVMEKTRLAPKGTTQVSDFLNAGADALVAGGKEELFTPMYFFKALKK